MGSPSFAAAVLLLLGACGATASGTPVAGGGIAGEPIPELHLPPPPGAEPLLSTLEPARLDPTDEEQMREMAGASAPRVFFLGLLPLVAAGGEGEQEGEQGGQHAQCPTRVEGDGVTVLRGDCTDREGTRWTGAAVIRGMSQEQRTGDVTYHDFGFDKTVRCDGGSHGSHWRANGRFVVREDGFTIDVAFVGEGRDERCNEMGGTGALIYEGRSVRTGSAVRWSGSGRYGWEGSGVVEATTEDELINKRNCEHEALMGTTTVRGAEHIVTFEYDGAEDCDEESTVSWSFDGQPQGELSGVSCAAAGGAGAAGPWWLAALALLLRRSSRGRPCPSRRSA